jgi:hypothetical protein
MDLSSGPFRRLVARSRAPGNALEVVIVNFFTVRNGLIDTFVSVPERTN